MKKMVITALSVAVLTLSLASPPANAFSDWIGAYGIIDKVIASH